MADTIFQTFDTTPTGAVAAIKAAILTSAQWSNPAGDRVQCTTTRGAPMVVDLADAAANAVKLQFGVYRTTGLADKIIRYLQWRSSGGATTDTLHCTVSAGKNHLLLTVEGPRNGETNPADANNGSYRPVFFLCDLLPYFASDTIPAVVCGGSLTAGIPNNSNSYLVHVSRNAADNASWVASVLETLAPPHGYPSGSYQARYSGQSVAAAAGGQSVVRPYVVFEDVAGMRGRLAQFFNMGYNISAGASWPAGDFPAQMFSRVTVGSATYIGIPINRYSQAGAMSPFSSIDSVDTVTASPVVAVPYS